MSFNMRPDNREDETIIDAEQADIEIEPDYQDLIRMSMEKRA